MIKNYTDIAFTEEVKKAQSKYGSREMYEKFANRMPEENRVFQREKQLIETIDGFFMATTNADGWPYVQFRGGPKGFLKVLDEQSIGFADFKGNLQYISTGNLTETGKASLILVHYPTRTRLKIWAEAEILDPTEHPELRDQLVVEGYNAVVERLIIFNVKALNWNCPQHIPQRYTLDEFKEILPDHPEILEDCCPDVT